MSAPGCRTGGGEGVLFAWLWGERLSGTTVGDRVGTGRNQTGTSTIRHRLSHVAVVHHGQFERLVQRSHHSAGGFGLDTAKGAAAATAARSVKSLRGREKHCKNDGQCAGDGVAEVTFHRQRMLERKISGRGGEVNLEERAASQYGADREVRYAVQPAGGEVSAL